jgi:hypothetical protein
MEKVGPHASKHAGKNEEAARESQKDRNENKKRTDADVRRRTRAQQARRAEIEQLEGRIASCEAAIRDIEKKMTAPGFYDDRLGAQPIIDQHQALMWQVGNLMHQWEELHLATGLTEA